MPTIDELDAILESEEPLRIEILPDGSIQAVDAKLQPLVTVKPKILTLGEALGEDY